MVFRLNNFKYVFCVYYFACISHLIVSINAINLVTRQSLFLSKPKTGENKVKVLIGNLTNDERASE